MRHVCNGSVAQLSATLLLRKIFPMTPGSDDRLDPRQERTHARVLAATRTVLRSQGLAGSTVDAIATEAGVARSTIYRNWPTREALVAAAFDDAVDPPTVPDPTLPLRDQVRKILGDLASALEHSEWGRTLPAVIAAIEVEPELAERYGRLTRERRTAMAAVLAAARDAGDLDAHTRIDDLVDALVGPLFYRRLIRRTTTRPAWIARHVERTLAGFTTTARRSAAD